MKDNEFYQELVKHAIRGTECMYGKEVLNSILERRLNSSTTGSTFGFDTVEELRSAIERAQWEPAPIEQAREISHGSIALVARDLWGSLGIVDVDDLPSDIKIDLRLLMPQSGKLNACISGVGFKRPIVDFATLVVEADKGPDGTALIMSTVCPGFISSKPNESGIFDSEYKGQRDGLTKEEIKGLGYKYVILT